jgi:hypothetical protein
MVFSLLFRLKGGPLSLTFSPEGRGDVKSI